MTDQQQDGPPPQQEPQGQTFTSGFDFTNHHLNAAMRYIERATPKDDAHIGPNTAFKLASQHTELARVGALATIAQQLQNLSNVLGGSVGTVAEVLHQALVAPQGPQDAAVSYGPPAGVGIPGEVDHRPQTGRDGAETLLDRQDGPRPPVTRFQQRQAQRAQRAQEGPAE